MRSTTPKKIIPLKPKVVPIDQKNSGYNIQYTKNYTHKSPTHKLVQSAHRLEQGIISPPHNHNHNHNNHRPNIIVRPLSVIGAQINTSPRHMPSSPSDLTNNIPPLNFSKQFSPKIADSIIISKSDHSQPAAKNAPQMQIRKVITYGKMVKQQKNNPQVNNQPPKWNLSASRFQQLPVRYESPKLNNIQRYHNSPNAFQRKRVEEPSSKFSTPKKLQIPIKIQAPARVKMIQMTQISNQTTLSSANQITILTRRMQDSVKINEDYQIKLQQFQKTLNQKDNQNKKLRKKISQLNQKMKEGKKNQEMVFNLGEQNRLMLENEIDAVKVQYGSDLFRLQSELQQAKQYRQGNETIVSNLQREQMEIESELLKFKEMFKNMKAGFNNVRM